MNIHEYTWMFMAHFNWVFFLHRSYVKSNSCMEEFNQAYQQVMDGKLSYIVVVLLQKPMAHDLPPELDTYLKTHTYIDAQKYPQHLETIRKRIRFAMPTLPLKVLKVSLFLAHASIACSFHFSVKCMHTLVMPKIRFQSLCESITSHEFLFYILLGINLLLSFTIHICRKPVKTQNNK